MCVRSSVAGETIRVSTQGGTQPDWRRDGRELYFLDQNKTLMAVAVQAAGERLEFGTLVPLFKAPVADPWGRNHYQPGADGRRFLINVLDTTQPVGSPDVVVVLDRAALYGRSRHLRPADRGEWRTAPRCHP